jgi:hypothetical protein
MICQALNFDDKLQPLDDRRSTRAVVNAGEAGVQTGVWI